MGSIVWTVICLEETLKVLRLFGETIGSTLRARAVLFLRRRSFYGRRGSLGMAQSRRYDSLPGESDGVSAGGKWLDSSHDR